MSKIWGWESKADFIDWCRGEALEVLNYGDRDEAFEYFVHNVEKHPDYSQNIFDDIRQKISEGRVMRANGQLFNLEKMKEFLMSIR